MNVKICCTNLKRKNNIIYRISFFKKNIVELKSLNSFWMMKYNC